MLLKAFLQRAPEGRLHQTTFEDGVEGLRSKVEGEGLGFGVYGLGFRV